MSREQRARSRVSKILSNLEPEVAARVAQSVADEFAANGAATTDEAATQESGAPPVAAGNDDRRPSFLQTEFRIAVGKELLDQERSSGGRR